MINRGGAALAYKPNLGEVVDRHRRLWTGQMPHAILARIDPDELPFVDPLSHCPDYQAMAAAWNHNYCARRAIEDDLLPVARVSFGSAAFGAYLGAEVTFAGGAGWSHPLLDDYDRLAGLRFDEENLWVRRQREACACFVRIAQGKFALCETEPIDGMNLAELLRGSAAYTDVYDRPADLHRLLDFACDFNIRFIEMQRAILAPCLYYAADQPEAPLSGSLGATPGLFSMFRIWLPGEAIWISVDAYGLCSPRAFRTFGAPYLRRSLEHFGGGWIHIHSSALHLLPELVKLPGVLGLGIQDDPNGARGMAQLAEVRKLTGGLPLQIDCTGQELADGLAGGTLPGGVMYMVRQGVPDIEAANSLMVRVRDYRVRGR
jgi:hypothetical protein